MLIVKSLVIIALLISFINSSLASSSSSEESLKNEENSVSQEEEEAPEENYNFCEATFSNLESESVNYLVFKPIDTQGKSYLEFLIMEHLSKNQLNKFEEELVKLPLRKNCPGDLKELLKSTPPNACGTTLEIFLLKHGIFFFANPILRKWKVTASIIENIKKKFEKLFPLYHQSVILFIEHFSYSQLTKSQGHGLLNLILNRATFKEYVQLESDIRLYDGFATAFDSFIKKFHNLNETVPLNSLLFSLSFPPNELTFAFESFAKAMSSSEFFENKSDPESPITIFDKQGDRKEFEYLINENGLFYAFAHHKDKVFFKRMARAITIVMGKRRFNEFTDSLLQLQDIRKLNALANVLYQYFSFPPKKSLSKNIEVVSTLNDEEKSLVKKWQINVCGFCSVLPTTDNLFEIHQNLVELSYNVQKKVISILSNFFHQVLFGNKVNIVILLNEYIDGEGVYLKDFLLKTKSTKGIILFSLFQNESIFEAFFEVSQLDIKFFKTAFQKSSKFTDNEMDKIFHFVAIHQGFCSYKTCKLIFDSYLGKISLEAMSHGFNLLLGEEKKCAIRLSQRLIHGNSDFEVVKVYQDLQYDRKTLLLKLLAEAIVNNIKKHDKNFLFKPGEIGNLFSICENEDFEIKVIDEPKPLSLVKIFGESGMSEGCFLRGLSVINQQDPFQSQLSSFIHEQLEVNFSKFEASRISKFLSSLHVLNGEWMDLGFHEILFEYSFFGSEGKKREISKGDIDLVRRLTYSKIFENWQQTFWGKIELARKLSKLGHNYKDDVIVRFLKGLQFSREELQIAQVFSEKLQYYSHEEFVEAFEKTEHWLVDLPVEIRSILGRWGLITLLNMFGDRPLFISRMIKAFEVVTPVDIQHKLVLYVKNLPKLAPVFNCLTPSETITLHNLLIGGYLGTLTGFEDISIFHHLSNQCRLSIGDWQLSLIWFKSDLGCPDTQNPHLLRRALFEMKYNCIGQYMVRNMPYLEGYLEGAPNSNSLKKLLRN